MAKDHYLPAFHIGQFSYEKGEPSRNNPVWARRRNVADSFLTTAAKVGYKKNLYTENIDAMWKDVEANLKQAITDLLHIQDQPLKIGSWLTLVRFIAQLFVRGYEFNDRFEIRLDNIAEGLSKKINAMIPNNTNESRRFELQRLYAPVMYANWKLVYNDSEVPIIINDLGYCGIIEKVGENKGYAIPLFPGAVLILTIGKRCLTRTIQLEEFKGEKVIAFIQQTSIDSEQVKQLNETLSEWCIAEIYGPTKESVNYHLNAEISGRVGHQGEFLIPEKHSTFLRECEMDYFKFLQIAGSV